MTSAQFQMPLSLVNLMKYSGGPALKCWDKTRILYHKGISYERRKEGQKMEEGFLLLGENPASK